MIVLISQIHESMCRRMVRAFLAGFLVGILFIPTISSAEKTLPDTETLRKWIQEMKESPRGPFKRIRWFCNDGTVQPPRPYACAERGGGVQHGEWNDRVKLLRGHGYYIANVLADIKPEEFVDHGGAEEILEQILLEQFLVASDDGWIFRRAFYYPGALQVEDEMRSGHNLLRALVRDPYWRTTRFTLLHEAVRLLPHLQKGAPITEMRQLSLAIAEKDRGFESLRVKIHVKPDARDAERVRTYAAKGLPELSEDYQRLAATIDEVYRDHDIGPKLASLAGQLKDPALARALKKNVEPLSPQNDPATRLEAASNSLALIRNGLSLMGNSRLMIAALDVGLELEREVYRAGNELLEHLSGTTRRERFSWLRSSAAALYGTGLISPRQWHALQKNFARLSGSHSTLSFYKSELDYLSRVPEWAQRWLCFHFCETVEHLARIEPLTGRYLHDRLHGSPLLFYGAVLDSLLEDANALLGIRHELFGETVAGGLRGLNPGLARGVLRFPDREGNGKYERDGIYVLPATTSDLPPVAGIVTAGEGNSLSHVQLLARSLGIPNVVVGERLLARLRAREGMRVVLAVSPRGVVRLAEDGSEWEEVLGGDTEAPESLIRPDLAKLDLQTREIIPLDRLRASDSGRIAGPKAANLGELRTRFPEAVPDGLVIPFGVFRALLDRPMEPGGPSVFRWLQNQYRILWTMQNDPEQREQATYRLLERLRHWILRADPGADFRESLYASMTKTFGPEGTYGVFVRSDTNVEDLPGFTGAGLNLTVPNVVGLEAVLEAITRVWASPFTERAYAWRQAHMELPEHVYASVLLMRSVPVEKSGVMVTADLENGRLGWLSVAVNEGVGGAVAGQEAEELLINTENGQVRLMAQATEPRKRILLPAGGVAKAAASGRESVLEREEIRQLIELAATLPSRFPSLRDADGREVPADIEFGFYEGRLVLFQIRPFLESPHARRSRFLSSLDRELDRRAVFTVDLDETPSTG